VPVKSTTQPLRRCIFETLIYKKIYVNMYKNKKKKQKINIYEIINVQLSAYKSLSRQHFQKKKKKRKDKPTNIMKNQKKKKKIKKTQTTPQ
jgi:hypothetical protein